MPRLVGRDADALRRELAPGRRLLVLSADEATPGRGREAAARGGHDVQPDDRPRQPRLCRRASDRRHRGRLVDRWRAAAARAGARSRRRGESRGRRGRRAPRRGVRARRPAHQARPTGQRARPAGAVPWRAALGRRRGRWIGRYRVAPGAPDDRGRGRGGQPRTRGADRRATRPPRRPTASLSDRSSTRRTRRGSRHPTRSSSAAARATPVVERVPRRRSDPGRRLVAHGVTLETEQLLAASYDRHGGELTRISVEHAAPLGDRTGWAPLRTVTQWAVVR